MANKDAKQNEKKRREKEITASYYHLVVPAGTDVINTNGNGNDNGNAHEEVVDEHTVAATEVVEEGSITDKDGNFTSLEGRPVLQSPPPVNSKRKDSEAYESKHHEIWNILFMELVEYKEENGHCNIPTRNGTLGGWIQTQRALFRSKKLKADRHEKLVGIRFTFEDQKVATDNERWNTHFMELVEYKKKNGHCNIPFKKKSSLGSWVTRQRALFKSKKLKADRYEKLVGIGFVFEDARFAMDNQNWNRRFMELVEYKEENGHCNIPIKKNGSLRGWIQTQRALFRSNKLKADRHENLVGIGFTFEGARFASDHEKWNALFMELVKFKEMNGHCNISTTNGSLRGWIQTQRALFRSNKLKADRHENLVGIGFTFEGARFATDQENGIDAS
jgi:hypothetical protein